MSAVFLKLLNMSIAAGWLVLAVIVLRLCLKKAPKTIHCALWALVAVRLLCPVSLESNFSLIPEEVANGRVVSEWTDGYIDEIDIHHSDSVYYDAAIGAGREPISDGEGGYYVVTKHDQLGEPATIENTVVPVLSWVWLAGVAALLLYAAVSYLRICSRVKVSLYLRDNIWQNERVDSPFILGVFRPRIYLPFGMDEEQMNHVVAHEQAHLSRRDHWWKPLGFVLLAVYWFNPLMWVAYILLCRDIELACDEKVIRDMGAQDKKAYSEALLACSVPRRMIAACPLAFGEVGVKKRIASVLHYKKPAFWILVVALVASVAVAVCFLTNPAEDDMPNRMEDGYYLLIGAEGVQEIRISLPDSGGGVVNADGSFFKKGEEVYLAQLQNVTDLRGVSITALGINGEVLYMLSIPEGASDAEIINIVGSDGWLLAPTKSAETTDVAANIWSRRDTSDPVEMLVYLCQLDLWNDSIEKKPQISVPGNFGPHAQFSETPNDADALDVAMARRACLLMRLYPEEVFYVMWSYPDAVGNSVRREFHADEVAEILSLSSDSRVYEVPETAEDVARQISFLSMDEKLLLNYAEEGNALSPLLEQQKNAVWFAPEDIHDIEYMELVWHDGQRFTPLTGEGYDYIETRFSSAKEIGATGCPYHNSVLYLHRTDGVVGKVWLAEDSCDVFLSGDKYYQFGDRTNPPYYDSNETFFNHFGTSVNDLPHYTNAQNTTVQGGMEQYEFSNILGCSGYVMSDSHGFHKLRSYYAVAGSQRWLIAETFGFGEAEDYVVDLDGDGITELIANVTYGGDGVRRAYVYQRKGDEIYRGDLTAAGFPDFYDWGANSTWSEYDPATGIFRLHYSRKGSDDYGVFETRELDSFRFEMFSPAPPVVTSLNDEELAQFNELFEPIVYDRQGNSIGVNPWSCFFTSYYDDVRNLNFEEFLRYFPGDGSFASDAEFEALKGVEVWPFDWVKTRDDMPVPIHKYPARIVDLVLKERAGITTEDLDTSSVAYLEDYDAYYNYTSDFGPGMFTCTRGEMVGDIIRLYEEFESGTDMLTLRKVGNSYQVVAHQCIEGDNAAERVYGR